MTRAPAIGLFRWLTIPEIGGAAGEASTGEETGAATTHPPEMHTGKSQANAADRRRLITGPEAPRKVYDGGKSIATGLRDGSVLVSPSIRSTPLEPPRRRAPPPSSA